MQTRQMMDIFPDKKLAQCIAEILSRKVEDAVTDEQLQRITSLEIMNKGVESIEGLENLTKLESLHLSDNEIRDISLLKDLSLSTCQIENNKITLSDTQVGEVTEIKILNSKGEVPSLTFDPVGSGVYENEGLTWHKAGDHKVSWTDGYFTGSITQKVATVISNVDNRIIDIFPDERLAQGIALHYGKQVRDLITTQELSRPTGIDLNDRGIIDLEGMQHLRNLQRVNLRNNKIRYISSLSELELVTLDLAVNEVRDISVLSQITTLRFLYLNNNQIMDLRPLLNLSLTIRHFHNQNINLSRKAVGRPTKIELYNLDGSRPRITCHGLGGTYDVENSLLTWHTEGTHRITWTGEIGFGGTATLECLQN